MRIIDDTSNKGRQIVPEDMNYLSLADREVVGALESLMKAMAGIGSQEAVVMSGCAVSYTRRTLTAEGLYRIGNGVIMWNGVLWDLEGMEVTGTGKTPMAYNTELSIVFDRTKVVSPSPVYGMTLELDQEPHKRMTARVVESNSVPKGVESIQLGMLKRMPIVGIGRGVNDLLLQTYNPEEAQ